MKRIEENFQDMGEYPQNINQIGNKIMNIKNTVMPFVMVLFFMIFLGVGIFVLNLESKDKKECTMPVKAIVVDLVVSTSRNTNNGNTVAPVYEFEYEGEIYKVQSNNYSSPSPFSIGDSVQIYVEPENPRHIYNPKEKTGKIVGIVFTAVGGIGMLIALINGVKILVTGKRRNGEETYYVEENPEYTDDEPVYYSEEDQF